MIFWPRKCNSSRDSDAKGVHRLQEVSGNTEETTKGSGGASDGLVGSAGEGGRLGRRRGHGGTSGGSSGLNRDNWDRGVGVGWDYRGDSWLEANSAWAVGNGDRLRGSGSVGDTVVGQGGGLGADGGEDVNGGGDPGLVAPGGGSSGQRGNDGELGELHFDGFGFWGIKMYLKR